LLLVSRAREGGPAASGFDPAAPARSSRVGRFTFCFPRAREAAPSGGPDAARVLACGAADFYFEKKLYLA
jgi:hypothetical protein